MTPDLKEALERLQARAQTDADLRLILDDYERVKGAQAWRTIETAPKNVSIQVFIPGAEHYRPGIYRAILIDMGTGSHWQTTGWGIGRDLLLDVKPTYWMPLPSPPQADGGGR